MIQQLVWFLIFRSYVALFLCAFLMLSYFKQGMRRTLIWLISGYFVAWAAEWGCINFDFPFGWYIYHYDALENDLIVFGVPFFDSLSFMFLSYVSFSFAQFFLSSLQGRGLAERKHHDGRPSQFADLPYNGIRAPGLWFGIVLFQLSVTYWLALADIVTPIDRERILLLVLTGCFVIAPILLLTVAKFAKLANRGNELELIHGYAISPIRAGSRKLKWQSRQKTDNDKGLKSTHS
jgi:hypothetical protein